MNRFTAPVLLAFACGAAGAAQPEPVLEELVVTSSRVAMPMRQVGTSVSVLAGQEIDLRGFNALYDVLRTQPGVAVTNTGGPGGLSSLQIRGESGFRTLVLLDGIDISDTSGPQVSPRIEHLLSSGIQRVEILRGPQGLMYGADAGGVVNIQTLAPEQELGGFVEAEAGRFGTRQLAGRLAGGNGIADFSLSAADYRTDGFNARDSDTVLRDDDGYDNTTLHGRFGWNPVEALRLQLVLRDVEGSGDYDGCFSNSFAPSDRCLSEFEQQSWRLSADYATGRFSHGLAYSGNDTERQDYTGGEPTFGSEGDRERLSYVGSFDGGDRLKLVYGVDLLNESLVNGGFDRDRDQEGAYLEYQGEAAPNLYLTAGIRHDDNEDFGSFTTWRGSAAYLVDVAGGAFKIRGAYGTGFRAPSLYEIAFNQRPGAFPPARDTELDAEESEGLDLGVGWYGDDGLMVEATWFRQEIDDLIDFDLVSFSGYIQDRGLTTSEGVELGAGVPLPAALFLSGNYTWNDTEQVDGSVRPRRPEHLANLTLAWAPLDGDLQLALHLRTSRGAEDTSGIAMDDYEVLNLSARWRLLERLELNGRVENLLDEDYQEVPGFNTAGAAAYAGVRYTF